MKKLIITLLGCSLAGHVSAQENRFQTNAVISTFLMPERRTKPVILAHRGGPDAGDTENSLETFRKAINDVPDAILEMDVRMTKDSVLTLLHDDELERTTTGTGSLNAQTWPVLSRLQLRDLTGKPTTQKMPLFEEVLRWNRNRAVLALDIKPGVDLRKAMAMVEKHKALNSVLVICYTVESAVALRQTYPDLWLALGVTTADDPAKFSKAGLPLHHLVALTPRQLQPKAFYEAMHAVGIPCSVGTYGKDNVDEQPMEKAGSAYRRIVEQGGDILTTDRPAAVDRLFR
ncbi:glycerophosphodiester phosphodiesterase family protein [Arsenicibacter rosenii]|uniref:GP-PDE domain-containing protein n=1 Tax=Arsenicibacter rosenii TaxID=1750698 RepID=A0A1S2VPY8_9BACT|nr:glycerophosphodiester phosphodiesterase family protein [Arsenicibacter rosenii]OIN60837.1 hypothetical protein BLX24_01700 [Arsenicibacter rosenii]